MKTGNTLNDEYSPYSGIMTKREVEQVWERIIATDPLLTEEEAAQRSLDVFWRACGGGSKEEYYKTVELPFRVGKDRK